jgi:DNA-binding transcriptional MerR regulator
MLKKIMDWLQGNNITLTDDLKAEMEKQFPDKPTEPPAMPQIPAGLSPEMKALIETQAEQNRMLGEQLKAMQQVLAEEKKAREESVKALNDKAAAEKKQKVDAKIEEMKKQGKIPAKNDELEGKYRKLLDTDYETALAVIEGIPAKTGPETPPSVPTAPQDPGDKRLSMIEAAKNAFKTSTAN